MTKVKVPDGPDGLREVLGDPAKLKDGWNDVAGERVYYISNPALGLWAYRGRFGKN